MITAKEARERSISVSEAAAKKQLDEIEKCILATVNNKGDCEVYFYGRVYDTVKEELSRLGYVCTNSNDMRDGPMLRIRW